MARAWKNRKNIPLTSNKKKSPQPIPRRKPVHIRMEFLLSLSLQLCVTQSTTEDAGRMSNNGRYSRIGRLKLKNHAIKTLAIPVYIPVHLAHR